MASSNSSRLWAGTVAFDCQGQEGTLFTFDKEGNHTVRRTNVCTLHLHCSTNQQTNSLSCRSEFPMVLHGTWKRKKCISLILPRKKSSLSIMTSRQVTFPMRRVLGLKRHFSLLCSTVIEFPKDQDSVPDGMTIDTDGNLWIAIWGGSCVACYNPETGECLKEIPLPALNITSCCWGGPDLDVLYVTSAACDTDLKKYPAAGCLFAVRGTGSKGHPMNTFSHVKAK